MISINRLAATVAASVIMLGVPGLTQSARADSPATSISGDSGSTEVATAAAENGDTRRQRSKKQRAKKICTREKVPGSHIRKRICRTQAEIDAQRSANARSVDDLYTSPSNPGS